MAIQLLEKVENTGPIALAQTSTDNVPTLESDSAGALRSDRTNDLIIAEQRFTLPGDYTWAQFLELDALMGADHTLRITYLDGRIELMTTGELHESIKSILGFLVESYLVAKGIRFFPVGNATRQNESKTVSFEPDESYYLWEKKTSPDLAIEIIMTSGTIKKLEKYRRVNIKEVWFWQNEQLSLYHLRESGYEQIVSSELLPDLDIELLVKCVQMSDILEARTELLKGLGLS